MKYQALFVFLLIKVTKFENIVYCKFYMWGFRGQGLAYVIDSLILEIAL